MDSTNTKDTGSLKLATTDTTSAFVKKTIPAIDLENYTGGKLSIFVPNKTNITSIALYFGKDYAMTGYMARTFQNYELQEGWNELVYGFTKASFTNMTAQDSVTAIQVRINVTGASEAYFDKHTFIQSSVGNVVFTMDDNWDTQYSVAYPILDKYGFKGNIATIPSRADGNVATSMTVKELRQVYYDGWNLVNHTYNHLSLDTLDKETQRKELKDTNQWLKDNGLGDNGKYLIYPYGKYNSDTVAIAQEEGFIYGRTLLEGINDLPINRSSELRQINLVPTVSVDTAKKNIDAVIETGGVLIFTNHRFEKAGADANDPMFYDPAKYEEIVAYCKQKHDEYKLNVMTFSELHDFLTSVVLHPIFTLNSTDGKYYSPTTDVTGFDIMTAVFVPQTDNITVTIQVSDDGLVWTDADSIVLPTKSVPNEYTMNLEHSHVRFIATGDIETTIKLKEE